MLLKEEIIFHNFNLKTSVLFDLVLVNVNTVDKVDINEALIFLMLFDELSALGHAEFGDKRLVCQCFSYKFY